MSRVGPADRDGRVWKIPQDQGHLFGVSELRKLSTRWQGCQKLLCLCVWRCRSQIWKLPLKLTFTTSIVVKGNFVRHTKRKNKAWKSLYSEVHSWNSAAPIFCTPVSCINPMSLQCRDAVRGLSASGSPFVSMEKKKVMSSTSLWVLNMRPVQGSRDALRCHQVVESLPAFDFFFPLEPCPEYSF